MIYSHCPFPRLALEEIYIRIQVGSGDYLKFPDEPSSHPVLEDCENVNRKLLYKDPNNCMRWMPLFGNRYFFKESFF